MQCYTHPQQRLRVCKQDKSWRKTHRRMPFVRSTGRCASSRALEKTA